MNNGIKKINEGFVAGVGFGNITGYRVGMKTQGLYEHPELLVAFEDGRKDIIFDSQAEKQSITIFPANDQAMTLVSTSFVSGGETDHRSHSFCHGIIVDNATFSKEILPNLDTRSFNDWFQTGPAEDFVIEDSELLRFHPSFSEDGNSVGGEVERLGKKEDRNVRADNTDKGEREGDFRKRLYAFALRTVAAEAHYIVTLTDACPKTFLMTLYEMLPPPFRYHMESCSCGEYDHMLNVLIETDKPYRTEGRYKKVALTDILQEDITEQERKYPKTFRISADNEARKAFYEFLEETVPYSESRKKRNVQNIEEFLEKKAEEYVLLSNKEAKGGDVTSEGTVRMSKNREDVFLYDYDRMQLADSIEHGRKEGAENTSDKNQKVMSEISSGEEFLKQKLEDMSEAETNEEAYRLLPDKRLKDLVDSYILNESPESYQEIWMNIMKPGVGERLRSIQQMRLRNVLVKRDFLQDMRNNNNRGWIYYANLVMLAYQIPPEEYALYQIRSYSDEILCGPYRYNEIRRFIKGNTYHEKKLLSVLKQLCDPFA